ncbi:hypothetical protein N7539_004963 [Penicillium diatomitis]|uniref:Uncharacterized protein n=1 Tax=Penicillium diatomitis TaxID=2819901 RepID=A0A9W9X797_9EURO|nr:uncharacterized protein N7539_004963 [Penicillium diatomitis]KAJ5484975.1 hypothetical protein N7539_004963 [Penicillium diatomitis]
MNQFKQKKRGGEKGKGGKEKHGIRETWRCAQNVRFQLVENPEDGTLCRELVRSRLDGVMQPGRIRGEKGSSIKTTKME